MFTIFYTQVFPIVGEFFGKLVAISSMPFSQFIDTLNYYSSIPYTNVLTGSLGFFTLYNPPGVGLILRVITFGVDISLPVWAVFLISFLSVYFIISLVKIVL